MEAWMIDHQKQLISTILVLIFFLIFRFLGRQTINKVGKLGDIDRNRTRLVIKYVDIFLGLLLFIAANAIWGVDFEKIGILLSSVFAVLGVALFAQWSILSNVSAGVILFFSFPFKIGDQIRILDKDFPMEAQIEDIKAFHLHLRTLEGELVTYPNNLILQKGVIILRKGKNHEDHEETTF